MTTKEFFKMNEPRKTELITWTGFQAHPNKTLNVTTLRKLLLGKKLNGQEISLIERTKGCNCSYTLHTNKGSESLDYLSLAVLIETGKLEEEVFGRYFGFENKEYTLE